MSMANFHSHVDILCSAGIIHSDLKPANFLVVAGQVKLIGFLVVAGQVKFIDFRVDCQRHTTGHDVRHEEPAR